MNGLVVFLACRSAGGAVEQYVNGLNGFWSKGNAMLKQCKRETESAARSEASGRPTLNQPPAAGVCQETADVMSCEIGFIFADEFESLSESEVRDELSSVELYQELDVDASAEGMPAYMASLYEIPLLTPAGEVALFKAMNYFRFRANSLRSKLDPRNPDSESLRKIRALLGEADRRRNQIVESNLRLVVSIARKFVTRSNSFDELVSEGNLILLKAVDKFDYSRGFRFSTYSTHAVQRHYYRFLQTSQRRRSNECGVTADLLSDLAEVHDEPEFDFRELEQLDVLLSQQDECLDDREQFILRERFGLGGLSKGRTLQELAAEMGLCKERVRQLHHKAVEKLRLYAIETQALPISI